MAQWFTEQGTLAEILDAKRQGSAAPIIISNHDDELLGTETGYGEGRTRPEDYLEASKPMSETILTGWQHALQW